SWKKRSSQSKTDSLHRDSHNCEYWLRSD
ncbi:iron-containing alcohol dehydrogenase family protein, partial [Vibrio parahaemolyticus AQ3810]